MFILGLCVVAGLPLMLGQASPGSVEGLMPLWVIVIWGAFLAIGALGALYGMAKQTRNGIIAEQVGSVAVGSACLFYCTAIYLTVGVHGLFSMAIITGWGLSCFWRWGQLQSLLHKMSLELAVLRHCELP